MAVLTAAISRLRLLWSGGLPLPVAFWNYAVFWGVLINIAASLSSLVVLAAAGASTAEASWPPLVALALHLLPTPYNILVLVGVWRSAARPGTAPMTAVAARIAVGLLCAVMLVL